jgi:hypothetical protein
VPLRIGSTPRLANKTGAQQIQALVRFHRAPLPAVLEARSPISFSEKFDVGHDMASIMVLQMKQSHTWIVFARRFKHVRHAQRIQREARGIGARAM